MQINSPDGKTVNVSDINRLLVEAAIRSYAGVLSEDGLVFSWSTTQHDILMEETALLIKNDYDGKALVVDKIITTGEDAIFCVHFPSNATFSGTAVSGVCLNTDWNLDDNASAYQHESVNSRGDVVLFSNAPKEINFKGELRIGSGKIIAIDYLSEANNSAVTLIGHFE